MVKFTISTHEIAAARAVVSAASPTETDATHGVAVVVEGGSRQWTAWSREVLASTPPVETDETTEGVLLVSPRLVEFGATIADQGHDIEFVVHDGYTTIGDGLVSMSFEHPTDRVVPPLARALDDPAARAEMPARALYNLFAMGRVAPTGVDLGEVESPPFLLTITDGSLLATVDWSDAGAAATEFAFSADTEGEASTQLWPAAAAHVVGQTNCDETVLFSIPQDSWWVQFESELFIARVRVVVDHDLDVVDDTETFVWQPLAFDGGIVCHGGMRPDPLEGASLIDVRAYTVDPDPTIRMRAAASRWNWDSRVQLVLANDEDERVVLALLDHVDAGVEACQAIIDGPHVEARRVLAARNLLTELLEQLANGDDPLTSELARHTLAVRDRHVSTTEVVK